MTGSGPSHDSVCIENRHVIVPPNATDTPAGALASSALVLLQAQDVESARVPVLQSRRSRPFALSSPVVAIPHRLTCESEYGHHAFAVAVENADAGVVRHDVRNSSADAISRLRDLRALVRFAAEATDALVPPAEKEAGRRPRCWRASAEEG